jgi:DNA-binding IclR family transcriptional regulator
VAAEDQGPRPISWSLDQLARRVRRVDLKGFAAIEAVWPELDAPRRSGAVPVRLAGGELVVAVASGAHATRARRDAAALLAELAARVGDAPSRLRVTVRPARST